MTSDELAEELTSYAGAKPGAQVGYQSVQVWFALWGSFFEAHRGVAQLPVLEDRLQQLMAEYPGIKQSDWVPRDGYVYMNVPLDIGLPLSSWKGLIDDSYELVMKTVDDDRRFAIEAATAPYNESSLLDRFIEKFNLQDQRDQILQQLVRHSAFLRTTAASDDSVPLGKSKLGGQPDLAPGVEWPVVNFSMNPHHGQPLAFLGQIDLAEMTKVGAIIPGAPQAGLISVFSAYGWLLEDNYDNWQPSSNVVRYSPPGQHLERREPPEWLGQYLPLSTLAVEPVAMLSLPSYREEQEVSQLDWDDEVYQRFDTMQMLFRSLQMHHWIGTFDEMASHHRFGGYARFPQMFPEKLIDDEHSRMLVQFASDNDWCSGMNWAGDGGDFAVYCDPRDGKFDSVQVHIQGS